ncbi:MAG TPA: nucleoside hydrolase [Gemmatimonadales bacterium]|nr:nucleoside hydrolase [Gemmatimonadales bacterium]
MPQPVVIDSDPGIDDSLALLLALASPELDVRGISVSYGNTVVENAMRNAVEIIRRAGRRLPLAVGARRPLKRALAVALETHGASGVGDAPVPPAGVVFDFMKPLERLLADQPEPVTLVTLGPVTSLASALKRAPDVVREKVSRHIAMIGNLEARGNTTPYSEFNAWCDPEALSQVVAAELPTDLVTLDVTREVVLSGAEVGALAQVKDAKAAWLSGALSFYHRFHQQYEGLDGCVLNDVLVIASLIDPSVLVFQPSRLTVSLDDGDERGRTVVDPEGWRVRVATTVRAEAVRRMLFERVLPWLSEPALAGAKRT